MISENMYVDVILNQWF